MKRTYILLAAGLGLAALGATAAIRYFSAPETPLVTAEPAGAAPAAALAPAAEPALDIEETAAALSARPDSNPDRRLMGVFRTQPKERSRAFVALKGQVASYAPGDKLPPDDAVLTEIEERYVLLQPPAGGPLLLALESTTQAHEPRPKDRQPLFGMNVLEGLNSPENPIRRLFGGKDSPPTSPPPNRGAPQQPAATAAAGDADDEDFDPYAGCEQLTNSDEQLDCEERIDAEIERLEETCDELDDLDAWDLCTEAATRMAVSNTMSTGATPPPAQP